MVCGKAWVTEVQSVFFTHTQHPLTPQWLAHCLGTQGKTFTIYYLFPPALSLRTNTQHRCTITYNNKSHYTHTHLCKSARSHKVIRKAPIRPLSCVCVCVCGNVELRFVLRRHNFCDSSSCKGRFWLIKKWVSLAGWPDALVKNTSGLWYDWCKVGRLFIATVECMSALIAPLSLWEWDRSVIDYRRTIHAQTQAKHTHTWNTLY